MELKNKFVCYIFDKIYDIWDITFDGKRGFNYAKEVYLSEFMIYFVATILLILCVSWWSIPSGIIMLKINSIHLNLNQYDIKFICSRKDNDGNNK